MAAQEGTTNQIEACKQQLIDAISETMDLYGATPSVGALYGVMFLEDEPMTLEEMKDTMGMSKSSMSYAVRTLMESKMVHKLEEKADRKDLYRAETDFYQAFQNFFTSKLQREINVMTAAIGEISPVLERIILHSSTSEEERSQGLRLYHKVQHAKDYYQWLQGFVDRLKDGQYF